MERVVEVKVDLEMTVAQLQEIFKQDFGLSNPVIVAKRDEYCTLIPGNFKIKHLSVLPSRYELIVAELIPKE